MATPKTEVGEHNHSITALLAKLSEGNREVEERLIAQVYGELHQLADHYMRGERGNHTLQPTALVHEAYARLVEQQPHVRWQSRAHFFATAAQLMRHILVDHARTRHAGKRGGNQHQVTLDEVMLTTRNRSIDVLALDEALERLAKLDPRKEQVVEFHYFGGLTFGEIGLVLDVTERAAKRDWKMARAWLKGELSK
jgi:RNA polymerase sigma-70 factor, ECF subfamily